MIALPVHLLAGLTSTAVVCALLGKHRASHGRDLQAVLLVSEQRTSGLVPSTALTVGEQGEVSAAVSNRGDAATTKNELDDPYRPGRQRARHRPARPGRHHRLRQAHVRLLRTVTWSARSAMTALSVALTASVALSACSGPAEHSDATLTRLTGLAIQATPPGARLLADASDAGNNSSISGKQPAVQRVFSTTMTVRAATAYYRTTFPAYRLAELPGPDGSQILTGHLGLDSVFVTISPTLPKLNRRPQLKLASDGSATYIALYAIAGGT